MSNYQTNNIQRIDTNDISFFGNTNPTDLAEKYGTPRDTRDDLVRQFLK
jgi:hypothetical protein